MYRKRPPPLPKKYHVLFGGTRKNMYQKRAPGDLVSGKGILAETLNPKP